MDRRILSSIQKTCPDLRSSHGFAILLYSYLVVGFLAMFATTLLMLSTLDVSQAQRSATLSQAFWAAEGELEASISQLRLMEAPALGEGVCQAFGNRALTGAILSSSQLCGTLTPNTYQLTATGRSGTSTDTLSTTLAYTPRTVQFNHVAYADEIFLAGIETGSMDTQFSRVITRSSVSSERGDLATGGSAALLPDGGWWRPRGNRISVGISVGDLMPMLMPKWGLGWEKFIITEDLFSTVQGDVYVGPGGDVDHLIHVTPGSVITGARKQLESIPTLPPIEVPSDAVNLGRLVLRPNEKRCLATGVYVADFVDVGQNAELCTTGPVELYLDVRRGTRRVRRALSMFGGARFYGQPLGTRPYRGAYSPQDLRIMVKGNRDLVLSAAGVGIAEVAAVIYAPESHVLVWDVSSANSTNFLGAIVARRVIAGDHRGERNMLLFDRALLGKKFRVGPATVTVKHWSDSP